MCEYMIFCIGNGSFTETDLGYQKKYRIFNKEITKTEYQEIKSKLINIELPLCTWVQEQQMTEKEKTDNSSWKQTGGFLRKLDYELAWKQWWISAKWENKNKILNLPHFDKAIFTKITGITKII